MFLCDPFYQFFQFDMREILVLSHMCVCMQNRDIWVVGQEIHSHSHSPKTHTVNQYRTVRRLCSHKLWELKGTLALRRSAEFCLTDMDIEERDCSGGGYFVQRKVLDELCLDEVAQKRTWSTKPTLSERVKESLR